MDDLFPKVALTAASGARAEVYVYGAHVTSWITPDGQERLFMSRSSEFRPGAALRGGIPVVFPQFSGFGPLIKHGFGRINSWEQVESQAEKAHFQLRDSDETRIIWNYGFLLDLEVTVEDSRLEVAFQVTNTDTQPFEFTAALHTYFRVDDISNVWVEGLEGLAYQEHGNPYQQPHAPLRVEGEVDRIYWNVPGTVKLREGSHTFQISIDGFPDMVVWNPGPRISDALVDMEPGGYHHMLCIEAVVLGQPVKLKPGEMWHGTQKMLSLT
ncbi:MAG TPA: D-hexose-6-phosphate mutarotase [Aggregatilineaceae bacterium]|nr:D-hexose-6-phosphate mutarotase [Aggregatilineaceae bacterium]